MTAVLVQVADAVTNLLAAQSFGVSPWSPVRSYADFDEALTDMDTLHVDVVPNQSRSSELLDRGTVKYVCPIDVGIRRRFNESDQNADGTIKLANIDAMVLLVEQVHEFFLSSTMRRLPTYQDAAWTETTLLNSFNRKHLRENRQFTALVRLGYEVPKELL